MENVGYAYGGGVPVLQDVSYPFEKGKIYAIVGRSGAGKTTLLSLLSALTAPTAGRILFDGRDIRQIDQYRYRSQYVGVVFQSFNLLPNLTAVENVELSMDIAGKAMPGAPLKAAEKRRRAMELLEKDVVIFTLYPDKPAEMVFDAEDIVNHDGIFGITCEDWQSIHDTIPARDVHRRFLETPGDAYAVMQLKGSASAELRYTGLNYLSQPPSPGNYDILYTGPIACAQNQSATLEKLFEIFNINRPGDFTGHSLSVSDIIALKQDGVVSYHYCDNVGFQELPGFMSENYLKAAEMSTEDDYGMIDGIINNGKQPISLMDGTERNPQEKKPSVLKKLKEQPPQSASERKPRKTKEKEI